MEINTTDFEIVKDFLKGNEIAFNTLVKKHQNSIYWFARRMLGNHLDADEITQETLIVLYNKLHTFKFNSSLSTWIYTIVRNRTLNYIKLKKVKSFIGLDNDISVSLKDKSDIVKNYEDKEKLEKVKKILNKLPTRQREVFVWRNFEGLSYEEISKITNKSTGSLKASYHIAINKIMDEINEK